MTSYPAPAAALVAAMTAAAAVDPSRAIAFQGAPGAYSHQAVREAFPDALPLPCFSFDDAIEAVQSGRAGRAVIPIENSLHGRVADIHFLLPESGLAIVGEHFVRVRHCLLGVRGAVREDVRVAISHEQALGQVRRRLADWGIAAERYADTAGAAALVAEAGDPARAAVASRLAAELYDLDVLAENIEDAAHNTTRFVVLSREAKPPAPGYALMTSLLFEVRSVPAALFKALGGFATNGVNLTKLESYLKGGAFSAAEFYADIEGTPDDPGVARALDELRFHTNWVRILGTYPQARSRELPGG
ncbi:prephenate dehydratase [Polymorphobacter sp. PAMC 29334]|uniref:prephenate dehydratase n=1 Tax=Polymorphobacter sp. PAMC 29334 TaxID=2862331 RepID=UPI001C764CF4|nr:prephenate dehydratase [Polymorphobacter sp. PAMC 29334]QYE34456.1 prephenate dehydratase [Polymorphobacter sp. PAMC 29334]